MAQESDNFPERFARILAPNSLGYRLKLLSQVLERRFQEFLLPHELTPMQWGILCRLWIEDGLPTLRIAEELGQLGGTIAVALPLLEKVGYIRRRRDKDDRRVLRVWLTAKGQRLKDVLPAEVESLADWLFEDLTQRETALLSRVVDKLRNKLDSDRIAAAKAS